MVQDLFNGPREPVDLVDEEHLTGLEVGHDRGEVAGALEGRAARRTEVDTDLIGDDVRERRLAQTRRSAEEKMVGRRSAVARSFDDQADLSLHLFLPDELREHARPERRLELDFVRCDGRTHDFRAHRTSSFKARFSMSSTLESSASGRDSNAERASAGV